ncbi:MAG: hypothetical protein Fur0034_05130 [Desulfuromonadia bacterium]
MKKTLTLIAVTGCMLFASSAFALTSFDETASTVIGGGTFKVSKGVTLSATSTTSAYAAIAGHTNGDKQFGTTSADPKIFTKTKTIGNAPDGVSSETYDFIQNGWAAQ